MPVADFVTRLTKNEELALKHIVCEVTTNEWTQYAALMEKFDAETLTEAEHEEFIALFDKIEGVEVKRLEYLAGLARQCGLPLVDFMRFYGVKSPSYV